MRQNYKNKKDSLFFCLLFVSFLLLFEGRFLLMSLTSSSTTPFSSSRLDESLASFFSLASLRVRFLWNSFTSASFSRSKFSQSSSVIFFSSDTSFTSLSPPLSLLPSPPAPSLPPPCPPPPPAPSPPLVIKMDVSSVFFYFFIFFFLCFFFF